MCKTAVAKVRWRPGGALHDLSDGCGRRDHSVGDEAGNLSIGLERAELVVCQPYAFLAMFRLGVSTPVDD